MERASTLWKGSNMDLGNNPLKRVMDLIGSVFLILLFSPLLIIIAFLIHRNGGSSLYTQERIGYGGKPFKCFKFRSMVLDSQRHLEALLADNPAARTEWDKDFKLQNDPRITIIGRFLRRTSLDQLPQLFNVLRGEMSLVGPRPVVADELARYGALKSKYHSARPGMTGLWLVNGRNNTTYNENIRLDGHYIENWKAHTDLLLMIQTLTVIFHYR